jgi:hypothetical protein
LERNIDRIFQFMERYDHKLLVSALVVVEFDVDQHGFHTAEGLLQLALCSEHIEQSSVLGLLDVAELLGIEVNKSLLRDAGIWRP